LDSISWMVHLRRNMLKNASSSPHASSRPRPKSSNKSATKPHPKSAVTASVPETFAILNAEIEESRDGESAGVQDITELFVRQLGAVQDVLANNHQIFLRIFRRFVFTIVCSTQRMRYSEISCRALVCLASESAEWWSAESERAGQLRWR